MGYRERGDGLVRRHNQSVKLDYASMYLARKFAHICIDWNLFNIMAGFYQLVEGVAITILFLKTSQLLERPIWRDTLDRLNLTQVR